MRVFALRNHLHQTEAKSRRDTRSSLIVVFLFAGSSAVRLRPQEGNGHLHGGSQLVSEVSPTVSVFGCFEFPTRGGLRRH